MSDEHVHDQGRQDLGGHDLGQEDVGSLGEEALRLFGALADAARQHSGDAAGTVGEMADHTAGVAREVNEHLATDAAECRYCPVCRVVHAVRQTSPEVRSHLLVAASSLVQAAAGLLESLPHDGSDKGPEEGEARGPNVERIDLDEEDDDA